MTGEVTGEVTGDRHAAAAVVPTLTRLRWWHIAEIAPIEEELFGDERWSPGMFWNELASGHYYLVALDGAGAVLGYAGLAVNPPDADNGPDARNPAGEGWIQNIAVRSDAQRHGLGRALLEALLAEGARRGVRRTLLEVAVDNGPAQKLYARYGFEPVGVRRGYYQPSNTDALVMLREDLP